MSDLNIGKISELEIATQWDSQTKESTSPKKNERYSKVAFNDDNDEIDESKMCEFQKALSLPPSMNKTFSVNVRSPDFIPNDNFFNDMIHEIEEDK